MRDSCVKLSAFIAACWIIACSEPVTGAGVSDPPLFDGETAYDYLVAQCDFGPRNPGSAGAANTFVYLSIHFKARADTVLYQQFTHIDAYGQQVPTMTNIIARYRPELTDRYLFCAHWDTRPRADRDSDPSVRDLPIIGANDGASGVAVLMALADMLKQSEPLMGVDLVMFDGEDYGEARNVSTDYFLGAKWFASQWPDYRPSLGVLLDMVGDSDLLIPKDPTSVALAPRIVERVWRAAQLEGVFQFASFSGPWISDDHVPLLEAGIKTINLIDFSYPYWHTQQDTPDKCSPASLQAVGSVLTRLIYDPDV